MYRPRRSVAIEADKSDTERWLVSYADYMTLLFALFVVVVFNGNYGKRAIQKNAGHYLTGFLLKQQRNRRRVSRANLCNQIFILKVILNYMVQVWRMLTGPTLLADNAQTGTYRQNKTWQPFSRHAKGHKQSFT